MRKDAMLFGLLGIGAYWLLTRSGSVFAAGPTPVGPNAPYGPPYVPRPYVPTPSGGSRTSGGPSAGGGGMPSGGGGAAGGGGASRGGGADSGPMGPGYITCDDGTVVNDPSLCPSGQGYLTCWDGTVVNDLSLCAPAPDTGDPCDPSSAAYDPSQCGSAVYPEPIAITDTGGDGNPGSDSFVDA